MRIDSQITTHFNEQIAADLFLSVFERCEFLTEVDPAVASFPFVSHELAVNIHSPGKLSKPALEFRTLHSPILSDSYVR
jgi:hypothetical protein